MDLLARDNTTSGPLRANWRKREERTPHREWLLGTKRYMVARERAKRSNKRAGSGRDSDDKQARAWTMAAASQL